MSVSCATMAIGHATSRDVVRAAASGSRDEMASTSEPTLDSSALAALVRLRAMLERAVEEAAGGRMSKLGGWGAA
jgi:hypothetical protein